MELSCAFAEFVIVDIKIHSSLVEKTVMFFLHVQHNSLPHTQSRSYTHVLFLHIHQL